MEISKELAHKCAAALVEKHNRIPNDEKHHSVLIVSIRSLYEDLKKLGCEFMIASAIRPANFEW